MKHSYFPALIRFLDSGSISFRAGETRVVDHPSQIPREVPFTIVKTNYRASGDGGISTGGNSPNLKEVDMLNVSKVSAAQYRVLRLIKQGLSVPEIADEIGRDFYTVREHVRNLRDLGFVRTARGRRSQVTVDLRRVRPAGFTD